MTNRYRFLLPLSYSWSRPQNIPVLKIIFKLESIPGLNHLTGGYAITENAANITLAE